jgi:hypothetical protein
MDGEIVTRAVDFIKEKMPKPIRATRKPSWTSLSAGSAKLGMRYMETRWPPEINQPPAAIRNPPAKQVTAAMKSAISDGVTVQSLRMLRLACWTIRAISVFSKH